MAELSATPPERRSPSRTYGETAAHATLKRLAVEWALAHRLSLCATEVRLPRSNYRADVAATTPRVLSDGAKTAVFECKASRADFLRDSSDEVRTSQHVASLQERLNTLRELIGQHRPDLRRSDELFPEFATLDLRGTRHLTHEQLTIEFRLAQKKFLENTKFSKLHRWRAASVLYVVIEPGVAAPHEIPDGWGLLVHENNTLTCVLKPCFNDTTPVERQALLERIAACATGSGLRKLGIVQTRPARAPGETVTK